MKVWERAGSCVDPIEREMCPLIVCDGRASVKRLGACPPTLANEVLQMAVLEVGEPPTWGSMTLLARTDYILRRGPHSRALQAQRG